jgi:hypothetical protein
MNFVSKCCLQRMPMCLSITCTMQQAQHNTTQHNTYSTTIYGQIQYTVISVRYHVMHCHSQSDNI